MFVYEILSRRAAVVWRAQWLVPLALGIGFVEILESSAHRRVEMGPAQRRNPGRKKRNGRQTVWRPFLISARLGLESRLDAARSALDRSSLDLAAPGAGLAPAR